MPAICTYCDTFRLDGRKDCKCGQKEHRIVSAIVYLRCEWCKKLFAWSEKSMWHYENSRPKTCSTKCSNELRAWNADRNRYGPRK